MDGIDVALRIAPLPDSGLTALRLNLTATEQVDLSGWLIAQERIDLNVTASTGVDAYVKVGTEATSFFGSTSGSMQVLNNGGVMRIATSGAVVSAAGMEASGTASPCASCRTPWLVPMVS